MLQNCIRTESEKYWQTKRKMNKNGNIARDLASVMGKM